jgi:nitroimidazol reductase NimA-like FMN-containing flavoprotein (pyridoxamine 5'-phosphate oxidase superfamily)
MPTDASGLEVLSEQEALALLATASVGRLVYSDRALPFVVPVAFALDATDIVIRTGRRSGPATQASGNVVAFEVDDIATARSGWTVVVTGQIERVDADVEVARLGALQLQTWAPAASDHYLRLRPELISGRRIPALTPPAGAVSGVTNEYPPDDFGSPLGRGVSDKSAAETNRPGFEVGEAAPAPVSR